MRYLAAQPSMPNHCWNSIEGQAAIGPITAGFSRYELSGTDDQTDVVILAMALRGDAQWVSLNKLLEIKVAVSMEDGASNNLALRWARPAFA